MIRRKDAGIGKRAEALRASYLLRCSPGVDHL
jgi:hypothetical protein